MVRHDLRCVECGEEFIDALVTDPCADMRHVLCGGPIEIVYRARNRNAQWSDRDACVLHRAADGSIRYPGRNDAPPPSGYERVEIRSMADLGRFEREHNVVSEIRHYDHGWHGFEREPGYDGTPVAPLRKVDEQWPMKP